MSPTPGARAARGDVKGVAGAPPGAPAIVGEGCTAKIRPQLAAAQLGRAIDLRRLDEQPLHLAPGPVVSKGEFARLLRVTPARVSQYLSEGKITGEAIVGLGRSARIDVTIARAQLRQRLDITQRLANGLNTDLSDPSPAAPRPAVTIADDLLERSLPAKSWTCWRTARRGAERG